MNEYPADSNCIACGMRLPPPLPEPAKAARFCPYCGSALSDHQKSHGSSATSAAWSHAGAVSLPRGVQPNPEEVRFSVGSYQILKSLGKGGMGEVFLAYDPTCGRRIALKRIREDLSESQQLHNRFLKEARLTSQLTHPAIIPIYAIHTSDKLIYYTMPYVEGETLKQILRTTHTQEKKGQPLHPIGGSIPALVRIFMTLCQAVAYAHAEGVLHRDLKPENVMVGRYGEVMILDWGLAKLFDTLEEPTVTSERETPQPGMTRLGKVVGTATYIAPECALGQPATVQSEVYALGVILYQLLTLHMPFGRKTMRDLRKTMEQGVFIEPAEVAPYREVPPMLSQIASKCLAFNLDERYQTVSDLIYDLELFLEGRSEWLQTKTLDIYNKSDWEFQENVVIAKHVEITRHADEIDWVSLMISRSSFPGNCMLECKVRLDDNGSGVGFLLSVPEAPERVHLTDGYCLWIGSENCRDTKLLLSAVEVMSAPDTYLKPSIWYDVRIEKIDNNVHFSLNNQLQFSYNSHLPVGGTHVGLLSRDVHFTLKDFRVYCGSQNLTLSCLAVPDAFLSHKYHSAALAEYRRIAYSFPGRAVGREALLSAGITLLDQGRACKEPEESIAYYDLALQEFTKLHDTAGAPLEYLGKALVYQCLEEYEEEIKCFELALRRYRSHPLLHMLQERVIHRLHESSRNHRLAAYHFALLVVSHLPAMSHLPNARHLFASLQKHWEPLPFLLGTSSGDTFTQLQGDDLAIPLSFWVAKPFALVEITQRLKAQSPPDPIAISNAIFCLIELGAWQLAHELLSKHPEYAYSEPLNIAILAQSQSPLESAKHLLLWDPKHLPAQNARAVLHTIEQALCLNDPGTARQLITHFADARMSAEDLLLFSSYLIWATLLENDLSNAGELLHAHPIELLSDEKKPLHFLYGCFLQATEGQDISHIHFSGTLDVTYPRLWSLVGHFLTGKISENDGWFKKAFLWEKRHLYRQLSLYYHCAGAPSTADAYREKERRTYTQ